MGEGRGEGGVLGGAVWPALSERSPVPETFDHGTGQVSRMGWRLGGELCFALPNQTSHTRNVGANPRSPPTTTRSSPGSPKTSPAPTGSGCPEPSSWAVG